MTEAESTESQHSRWRLALSRARKPLMAVAAIGTVLGGLAGYVTIYRTVAGPTLPAKNTELPTDRNPDPISVLVLPLENQTGDPAKDYVADALTTAITSDLTRLQGATIVPPRAAAGLMKKQLTLQELGTQARVGFVLQGGVSISNGRIRLTTHLSETKLSRQLWSKVLEAPMGDLFALQDEMTQQIRRSIGPEMIIAAAREAETRRDKPQVADLILRLRALELQQQSLGGLKSREELARQALAIDPENQYARASLARSLWLSAHNFASEFGLDIAKRRARAAQAAIEARKVLAENPVNVDMHFVLGFDARMRGDTESALSLYERALAIAPRLIFSYNNLGDMYLEIGEPDKARKVLLQGLQQPTYLPSPVAYSNLAYACIQLEAYDQYCSDR